MENQSYEKWLESRINSRKEDFKLALNSAYTESSMRMLLKEKLNTDYDTNIDKGKNFLETIFNIINYFDRKGCLIELLEKACDNPTINHELRNFYNSILEDIDGLTIKDKLPKEFEEICDSLMRGKLIFFLGSGINYPPDGNTENLPPSDIDIAKLLATSKDFKKVLGLPCQVCPTKLEHRPSSLASQNICPIWKEIRESPNKKYKQLRHEQDLAFARLEMRCLSQCILNEADSNLKNILRKIFRNNYNRHPYEPNTVHKTLAKLAQKIPKNNLFILTTNYDYGLEKAFDDGKFNFEVMYYFIDVNKSFFTGDFWHKSYFSNDRKNDDSPGEIVCQDYQLPQTPIIFKLYGGVLYKAKEVYDSFAIAESHFINYLQSPKEKFPEKLTNYLKDGNILFLGCNPNDADILALLHRFFPERFFTNKPRPEGWFINPLKPGEMHDEGKWRELGITLIDECSLDYLLSELQKYVEKKLVSQ